MFDIVTRNPSVVKGAESPLCVNKTYKFFVCLFLIVLGILFIVESLPSVLEALGSIPSRTAETG